MELLEICIYQSVREWNIKLPFSKRPEIFLIKMFLTCLFFFIEGRRHDAAMLADSNLLQDMQRYAFSPGLAGRPLRVLETPLTH